MAVAAIRIDQLANPTPTGVGGRARDDILLAQPVTLRNGNDTGVSRWRWTLLDVPIGSSATLSSEISQEAVIVPDIAGTYRARLVINDGLGEGAQDIRIFAVRDSATGLRYPAVGEEGPEANYLVGGSENADGWGKELEADMRRGAAVTQMLGGLQSDGPAAGSASEIVIVGALGLPEDPAEFIGYDFIDLQGGANSSGPPTVNGLILSKSTGFNSLSAICVGTWDLDTTATTAADVWAFVGVTAYATILLSKLTMA